jgi:hypothetical protein
LIASALADAAIVEAFPWWRADAAGAETETA